jgi:mRNA interferase HigB
MLIFGKPTLTAFVEQHEQSRLPIGAWQLEVEEAKWIDQAEVRQRYCKAELLPDGIVFPLAAGLYRLRVAVGFDRGVVIVKEIWATAKARKKIH